MKILITGRSGQVSRELQRALAPAGDIHALGQQALDLGNPQSIRQQVAALKPDLIVNAAAHTAVDAAEQQRELAFAVNAEGPRVLAEEAARLGVPLIHYSTDYVFDGRKQSPYNEQDSTNPLGVYGASKLAGERAIQAVGGQHLILRTSWVYARHGKNFLLTMQRLLQERDSLSVVDDQIGAPTWAGTIADTTAHWVDAWRHGRAAPFGLFHLTSSGETSWYGFAQAIAERLQAEGKLRARLTPIPSKDYPTPAKRPQDSRLDCSLLQRTWNIRLPEWREALDQCLAAARTETP
ncbi:dTDP-4-dehydrorhamnose reductase [Stutzerimonas kirkiae]|uniref:dTDP-4-dehydrorhamnose reductase n=1 Tax=Stutzerimonas kirkiae TaxID=2211392 RepID=UPI001038539E|nr:dTDP-4-dehydrorhamnose reductase [Stutzerimonas kirkiae]TBV08865.1 dTDP-4-dehydrorhamnose reductase [Stutzerimonas kirkiae]